MNYKNSYQDNIYLNLIIQAEQAYTPNEVPVFKAQKEYQLDDVIINRASDYYVTVESMTCPTTNIPVWMPDIQPKTAPWGFNTDINKTIYSFTMEYNGIYSDETFLNFISQNPNSLPLPLSPFQDRYSVYYEIYTYTSIVEMLNNTLLYAFYNLSGKIALPTSDIPYFYFDGQSFRFSLVSNKNFFDSSIVSPINIYCNYQMYEIINSLPFTYYTGSVPGRIFKLYISNFFNNVISSPYIFDPTGDYYVTSQNISYISQLSPMKSLFVLTNSVPINSQISPLKPSQETLTPNKVNRSKILLDIEPVVLGELIPGRNFIQYRDSNNEYLSLVSENPISLIDISVYWRDRFGLPHIVYLNYNQPFNIRLRFSKKSISK